MTTALPLADTRDMIGLHRVFREALSAASVLVGQATPGDCARAEVVGTYYDNVLRLLHSHHEGEDELMTPRLLERCTSEEAAVVGRVAAMHDDVTADLAAAEAAVAAWRSSASQADRDTAVSLLVALERTLLGHLDDEERLVLPIAAKYIDVAEWGQLPAHAMRTFTGDKMWLVLGLVQEQMPEHVIATMEANMPPPLLAMWESPGRRMFADFTAQLRAPLAA
jgi:hypothetical protein